MSKTIQIRKVPERVHRTLRVRAAEAGLSLSDYLLSEIIRFSERPANSDVLARSETRHGGASVDEVVRAVRAGRDRNA